MNDRNRLGMLLFIASEAVFFLLLIIAFVVYHQEAGNGAEVAARLDVPRTAVFTLLLMLSSVTVWLAVRGRRRGRIATSLAWIAATIALGGSFLVGQGREYAHLIREDVTISRDLFGTTFFTLTGFHGLHVLFGLVLLATLLAGGFSWRGEEPRVTVVENVSMYWHFVDAVWMFVFPVVYLWGRL
jgi:heme/copper-type cytochrome/quinol oxidase subunit 3